MAAKYSLISDANNVYKLFLDGKDSGYTPYSSLCRAMLQWGIRFSENEQKEILEKITIWQKRKP